MQLITKQLLTLSLLALASCASTTTPREATAPDEGPDARPGDDVTVEVGAFYRATKVSEVEFKDPAFVEGTAKDLTRQRAGVHASVGIRPVRAFLEVFGEDFMGSTGVGFGIGVEGDPLVHTFENGVELSIPYQLGGAVVGLPDAEALGVTNDSGYIELNLDVGVAARWGAWVPAVGVSNRGFRGTMEFPGEGDDDFDDEDLSADLASGYLELAYRPRTRGIDVVLRGMAGDETGVQLSAAWGF